MSRDSGERLSAWLGLALAACAAAWWLAGTRLALQRGGDAASTAAQALQALWHVRALAVAVVAVRVAALRGWGAGAWAGLAVVLPAWPVALLAWSASDVPGAAVVAAECALLAGVVAAPVVGAGLRRVLPRGEWALLGAAAASAAMGAVLFIVPPPWAPPFA